MIILEALLCLKIRISLTCRYNRITVLVVLRKIILKLCWACWHKVMKTVHNQVLWGSRSFCKSNVLKELPTVHLLCSSTKLNQLLLYISFRYIFVAMARANFRELNLSLGRRELIITSMHLHFFLITRDRLTKPSEIISMPLFLVPQWTTMHLSEEGRNKLFMCHNPFRILSYSILKLKVLNLEKCLSNVVLNLLKLTTIESPITLLQVVCKMWFLNVLYPPAFPLRVKE